MNVSVIVASYGDRAWHELGRRAVTSAYDAGRHAGVELELLDYHGGGSIAQARNTAASRVTGDWLCFLDADDQMAPDYLSAMRLAWEAAGAPGSSEWSPLLVPAVQEVDEAGNCVGTPGIPAWGRALIDVNCAVIGTLVPAPLFHAVGGFREHAIYEDWELWLRCVEAGAKLAPVPDAVYCAHRRAGGRNEGPQALATYNAIRAEHAPLFTWDDPSTYTV